MRVIEPGEIWENIRLLSVPAGAFAFDDFSTDENGLLNGALQILKFVDKPNGQRRSTYGLNRIAQKRFPEMNWEIGEVECITSAWRIAGLNSLADSIRRARNLPLKCGRFSSVEPKLQQSGAVQVDQKNVKEVFVCSESFVKAMKMTDASWKIYRVGARTNYGDYLFHVFTIAPASQSEIEHLCISHNSTNVLKNSELKN